MRVPTRCPLCVPLGEQQWRLSNGATVVEGHVADLGERGVECRLLVDGRCRLVERCATREDALATLDERREHYLGSGWAPAETSAVSEAGF